MQGSSVQASGARPGKIHQHPEWRWWQRHPFITEGLAWSLVDQQEQVCGAGYAGQRRTAILQMVPFKADVIALRIA